MVRGHQFDRFAAEEAYTVPLTALAKTLGEFGVIIDSREKTGATLRKTLYTRFVFGAETSDPLERVGGGLSIGGRQSVEL